jgi:hypothetical protein
MPFAIDMLPVATGINLANSGKKKAMTRTTTKRSERLFPADATLRRIVIELYESV